MRDKVVSKNSIMLKPHSANDRESDDERDCAGGVQNISHVGRHVEPNRQERKTKAEDQIAECLQPSGEAFAFFRRFEGRQKTHGCGFCPADPTNAIIGEMDRNASDLMLRQTKVECHEWKN